MKKRVLSTLMVMVMALMFMGTTVSAMTLENLVPYENHYSVGEDMIHDVEGVWTKRTPSGDGTWKAEYHTNLPDPKGGYYTTTTVARNGYFEINNIIREYKGVVYSNGPVTLVFHGGLYNYCNIKHYNRVVDENYIMGMGTYEGGKHLKTGEKIISMPFDGYDKVQSNGYDVEESVETFTLDKPGLYGISTRCESVTLGLRTNYASTQLYIAKPGEDVSKELPKTADATPEYKSITVNSKTYNCPGYEINGEYFVKARDVAYMFKGTPKQFNITSRPQWDITVGNKMTRTANAMNFSFNNHEYGDSNIYEPNGSEMKKLDGKVLTAALNETRVLSDGFSSGGNNFVVYKIAGNNYLMLDTMLAFVNAGSTYNADRTAVTLDVNTPFYD